MCLSIHLCIYQNVCIPSSCILSQYKHNTLRFWHLSGIPPQKKPVTVVRQCQDSGAPSPMELTSRSWLFMFLGYGNHPPILSPSSSSDPPLGSEALDQHICRPVIQSLKEEQLLGNSCLLFGFPGSQVFVASFACFFAEFLGSYARVTSMACTTQAVCVDLVFTPNLKTIW